MVYFMKLTKQTTLGIFVLSFLLCLLVLQRDSESFPQEEITPVWREEEITLPDTDLFFVGTSHWESLSAEDISNFSTINYKMYLSQSSNLWEQEQVIHYILEHNAPKEIILSISLGDLIYEDTSLPVNESIFTIMETSYEEEDVTTISSVENYLEQYPAFYQTTSPPSLHHREEIVLTLAGLQDLCQASDVLLTIISAPTLMEDFSPTYGKELQDLYVSLVKVVDFWDFSLTSLSFDPRFFYEEGNFRPHLMDMIIARMTSNTTAFVPESFGYHVTSDTISQHLPQMDSLQSLESELNSKNVPVLLYHHITEGFEDESHVTVSTFENQIQLLVEEGFTGISLEELVQFVKYGGTLPEKPVVITFDDGYSSNYQLAFPVLEKYNMKATMFVIGHSVGATTYKETETPIIPHFSYQEAQEMIDSGLISIQSHTYDMHQWGPLEQYPELARSTVLSLTGEKETDYISYLSADYLKSKEEIEANTSESVHFFAYPLGEYDVLSESILTSLGVDATFTVKSGLNEVVQGIPQSLFALHRFEIFENTVGEELLNRVYGVYG